MRTPSHVFLVFTCDSTASLLSFQPTFPVSSHRRFLASPSPGKGGPWIRKLRLPQELSWPSLSLSSTVGPSPSSLPLLPLRLNDFERFCGCSFSTPDTVVVEPVTEQQHRSEKMVCRRERWAAEERGSTGGSGALRCVTEVAFVSHRLAATSTPR